MTDQELAAAIRRGTISTNGGPTILWLPAEEDEPGREEVVKVRGLLWNVLVDTCPGLKEAWASAVETRAAREFEAKVAEARRVLEGAGYEVPAVPARAEKLP